MGAVLRIAAVLAALAVAGLVALAVALPRLVRSEAVQARLAAAAREATGREVRWRALDAGLLPPRLVVEEAVVGGAAEGAPPAATVGSLALVLEWLPLLARTVVVDSVRVEDAVVRLERTDAGLRLAGAPDPRDAGRGAGGGPPPDAAREGPGAAGEEPAGDGGVRLAVREVVVRGLELEVEDRTVRPPARGRAGPLAGRVRVRGGPGGPASAAVALQLDDGVVALAGVRAEGRAVLEGDLRAPTWGGPVRLDLEDAALAWGETLRKPAGVAARAEGVLAREGDAVALRDLVLRLADLRATGAVESDERLRAELSAEPFAAAGLAALLPALEGRAPGGRLALEGLRVATAPLAVHGEVRLDALAADAPGAGRAVLDGALVGQGASIGTRAMVLRVAEQPIGLDGAVELAAPYFFRLGARGEGLDGGALVRAASGRDFFEGPVRLDARLVGALAEERPLLESAGGRGRLDVGRGRIRGVSLLRSTFQTLGAMAEAAVLANRLRGSDTLERFYSDEFESIGATFELRGGRARTDDLRIVYRHYTADLRGSVGLADGGLDLTGKITLHDEAEREVRAKVIPIARITGTTSSPRIDLSPSAVASLAAREEFHRKRGDLEEELDERLGEGAGRALGDALEGLLEGR